MGGKRADGLAVAVPSEPVGPQSRRGPLWIFGAGRDFIFFVGTPFLIVPLLLIAQVRFSPDAIYLFVASFGSIGHHLPGMMRAYGDRLLFRRFRYRFVLAPLFLASVCVLFTLNALTGVVLIAYLWGVWHGLMQTYGFLRIYDAKIGSISPVTARLDRVMCIAWFGAAVVLSPTRMGKILNDFYLSGGPALPVSIVDGLKSAWVAGTAAVTLVYLWHLAQSRARGVTPSPVKLGLMATSFAFWWYSNVTVTNLLVGIALFEVFHDVQYLAIVWVFNLHRVEKNPEIGRFTRFLFRRSGALVGVYVGLVAAYGSLALVPPGLPTETMTRALTGLLLASSLLHFYYDGFIWKVREPSTRESLGLSSSQGTTLSSSKGNKSAAPIEPSAPGAWAHGLKWATFIIPVAWLGLADSRGGRSDLERYQLIVAAVPRNAEVRNNLGAALLLRDRDEEALAHLQAALHLDPRQAKTHANLGVALARHGDLAQAVTHYREALRLDPRQTQAYSNLGNVLVRQGQFDEAIALFEQGLRIQPNDVQAHTNLGGALLRQGRVDDAIVHLEEALRLDPKFEPARQNLEIGLGERQRR